MCQDRTHPEILSRHRSEKCVWSFGLWSLCAHRSSLRSCLMDGSVSCVTTGCTGRMRLPCCLLRNHSSALTSLPPPHPTSVRAKLPERLDLGHGLRLIIQLSELAFSVIKSITALCHCKLGGYSSAFWRVHEVLNIFKELNIMGLVVIRKESDAVMLQVLTKFIII